MAKPNIQFRGSVSDEQLLKEYSVAKAVLFAPELEYGLIPLEACATGTPVICYGRGGVLETMIPLGTNTSSHTAVFFDEQTPESLNAAIERFENCEPHFDPVTLRRHAERWSVPEFRRRIRRAFDAFVAS
jgi:glycosyltransferase involved in cell wall biosynthesis